MFGQLSSDFPWWPKDSALSQMWLRIHPWLGNFCVLPAWQIKKLKKKITSSASKESFVSPFCSAYVLCLFLFDCLSCDVQLFMVAKQGTEKALSCQLWTAISSSITVQVSAPWHRFLWMFQLLGFCSVLGDSLQPPVGLQYWQQLLRPVTSLLLYI